MNGAGGEVGVTMRGRTTLVTVVPILVGVAVLLAVRPGVIVNGVRSPLAWAATLGVLLAALGTRALVSRFGGPAWLSRTASTAVALGLLAVLIAPSFQQRTLVEDFPGVSAQVPMAAEVVGPIAPDPSAGTVEPVPAAAPASAAPSPIPDIRRAEPSAGTGSGGVSTTPAPVIAAPAPTPPPPAPPAPERLSTGQLDGIGHRASGGTSLYRVDGSGVVRFENVNIEGSVDPSVHLIRKGARTPDGGVPLGKLKAERGSFSYALPASIDLSGSWTILVWCDPFNTPIAAADLG